jgi:hypothetical protein
MRPRIDPRLRPVPRPPSAGPPRVQPAFVQQFIDEQNAARERDYRRWLENDGFGFATFDEWQQSLAVVFTPPDLAEEIMRRSDQQEEERLARARVRTSANTGR